MKRELIARVAHEINRAYCASQGDVSQPVWESAPEWQQQSALAGVDMHLANPDATPEQSHESWLAQKVAEGWVYGPVKDADKKEHPCCVPYADLPPEQKAKDYLFRGVVHALKDIPDALPAALGRVVVEPSAHAPGEVGVTYIGRREHFTDRLYGSNLPFVQGQTRFVPAELADRFLRHADQFQRYESDVAPVAVVESPTDDTGELLKQAQAKKQDEDHALEEIRALHDRVNQMDKDMLQDWANTHYRQKIPKTMTVENMRQKVISLIDQFGAV